MTPPALSLGRGVLGLLTVLLIAAALGTFPLWRALRVDPAVAAGDDLLDVEGISSVGAGPALGSQPVVGVPVVVDTLHLRIGAAGTAEAARESRVATRASGVVQRVFVREGQGVRAGDVLVQLDTAQAAMNLARAQAALVQAEARYEERMAGGRGILPAREEAARERIVRAEAGLDAAELDVAERRIELEFTRIRAPFSGRVADLKAVEGAFVENGAEVATLLDVVPIRIRVDVLESEIGSVAVGRRASVRFDALGGEPRAATVVSINPLVDPESRAGRVTLTLPNADGRIVPGSYAHVTLDTDALPERTLIPREAVLVRGDRQEEVVFVLRGADADGRGLAELRPVALGRRNDTHVEVVPSARTEMLHPGEIVLVDGHHFLALGTRVHLVEPAPLGDDGAAR